MTLREELSEYAERSAGLIEDSPQMDEENTKRKIIEPLIELLGWDILSSDVELEYSVQMGSGTKKVDYALKREGTPVVFVEAKGCDTPLDQSHENQLKSYMRQVGVDWGLLTNGRKFEIFRRDVSSNRPNEISLAEFSIEDVPNNEDPLKALSQEYIDSGESRQIAEKIEAVQNAVASLRENKETLAEDVTGEVTEVAGNAVSQQVEDEAKAFVDDLVETLEEQAHRTAVVQDPPGGDGSEDGEYVIRLTRNGRNVFRVAEDVQSEAVRSLVNYLIGEEGLLNEIDIPYIPGTGQGSRALLNDEPTHPNGSEMRGQQRVSGGYYLLTNLSSEDKKRYVSELPEKVGLEIEFSDNW
ncbi:type I restriction enzyme HsdR N-terminal domain-containing protein [Halobacterium salinarum]|uniref:type I restriction enzyme HsdR N-terminal domain-containing protein n=1 Tax=Halobacterium TaxID=2239 RepID=UPI002552725C|nr:type I restriction enzyme HsdR N-terminal domain-containing protein [Halobacterium salinarum]MDL0128750.1 type I restriction enzyme HsdR N-terminal domain-containing protein [Halobacterium salinarum]MDL0140125.1 type I restriction enzyme HsdR N-terminal domain-containing protein [Halobacterium salinarum]